MRVLFVHQNFPGQFRHLAVALAAKGHEVVALGTAAASSLIQGGVKPFSQGRHAKFYYSAQTGDSGFDRSSRRTAMVWASCFG